MKRAANIEVFSGRRMSQAGVGYFDILLHYSLFILKAKVPWGTAVLSNLIDRHPRMGVTKSINACIIDRANIRDGSLGQDGEHILTEVPASCIHFCKPSRGDAACLNVPKYRTKEHYLHHCFV